MTELSGLALETLWQDGEFILSRVGGKGERSALLLMSPVLEQPAPANGMGVGLSICRSIVDAHGGRIWASVHDGPGAVFRFSVPIGLTE